ncbi:MAG: hypothetical protein V4773_00110 [Verrucomicrobiota bacterium]
MNPTPESPDREEKLERLVHQTLRDLPARRAPRGLEQRVLAELERRAALPWWQKSFTHWPLAARAAFLVLGFLGVGKLMLLGSEWAMPGLDLTSYRVALAQQFAWVDSIVAVVHAIRGFFEILGRNIPPLWLYGGLAFFAAMYAAIFGLGAAAYKALRVQS